MSTKFLAAVLLCASWSADAQQKPAFLPDGPGKDQVAALCSGCHGVTPDGNPVIATSTVNGVGLVEIK